MKSLLLLLALSFSSTTFAAESFLLECQFLGHTASEANVPLKTWNFTVSDRNGVPETVESTIDGVTVHIGVVKVRTGVAYVSMLIERGESQASSDFFTDGRDINSLSLKVGSTRHSMNCWQRTGGSGNK